MRKKAKNRTKEKDKKKTKKIERKKKKKRKRNSQNRHPFVMSVTPAATMRMPCKWSCLEIPGLVVGAMQPKPQDRIISSASVSTSDACIDGLGVGGYGVPQVRRSARPSLPLPTAETRSSGRAACDPGTRFSTRPGIKNPLSTPSWLPSSRAMPSSLGRWARAASVQSSRPRRAGS